MAMNNDYIRAYQDSFDIISRGLDGEIYSIRDNKGYWISRNGEKKYPNQFKYGHLINTIKKIERECYECYLDPNQFKIYRLLKEEYRLRIENLINLERR